MSTENSGESVVSPGALDCVKDEQIRDTFRVWQPRYEEKLTPDDTLEVLMNVSNLFDVLFEKPPVERQPTSRG